MARRVLSLTEDSFSLIGRDALSSTAGYNHPCLSSGYRRLSCVDLVEQLQRVIMVEAPFAGIIMVEVVFSQAVSCWWPLPYTHRRDQDLFIVLELNFGQSKLLLLRFCRYDASVSRIFHYFLQERKNESPCQDVKTLDRLASRHPWIHP